MKTLCKVLLALVVTFVAAPVMAATTQLPLCLNYSDSNTQIPCTGTIPVDAVTGNPIPVTESVALVTANTPSASATIYGGNYIFTQVCSTYGTVNLQVTGPDGVTWLTASNYTTADTGNGHLVTFGSGSTVRVSLTGTTGCNAKLARVP